ncbi:MAG: hypothetical protein V3V92_06435, partial [Candidatus Hydrothermarchaeales archaeon]
MASEALWFVIVAAIGIISFFAYRLIKRAPVIKSTRELIEEAVTHKSVIVTIDDMVNWISLKYPHQIERETIATAMSDLSVNGPPSSSYREDQKFLFRVERGKYRLYDPETDGRWKKGARIDVEEPETSVELDFPEDLAYKGQEARVYARIENKGKAPVRDIRIGATFTDILGVDRDAITINFLAPGNVAQKYWSINPTDVGVYTIYRPTLTYKDEKGIVYT